MDMRTLITSGVRSRLGLTCRFCRSRIVVFREYHERMKTAHFKTASALGIGTLAVGLLALAGPAHKTDWKGRVLTEDGVRVVVNPAEPIYGRIKLDLGEELRIGKEGNEQTQFFRAMDVGADPSGRIYVVDARNFRVQVFDPSGKYLRTIGRQGQGPGEFEMPMAVCFGGQAGYTHVLDRFRRVNHFDDKGVFLRSAMFDGVAISCFPDAGSGFIAVLLGGSDEELTSYHVLSRINGEGKTQSVLARFPYTLFMERREGATLSRSTGYEMSLYATPMAGNSLVYGYSKDYELVVLGSDDKKILVIRTDEPRPEFTSAERAIFGSMPVPKLKPYFYGLLTDSDGRIYVQKNTNTKGKRGFGPIATEDKFFDVFSGEGRFLFRTALPPNTRVIRGDLVYTFYVDEEQGLEYVQRFRIKNCATLPKN